VSQTGPVEFAQNELLHRIGPEPFGDGGISDAALDVLVDAQVEVGKQAGSADEDEVVVFGEVFEQQPQPAEIGQIHEMGIVEDGGQRLAGMVEGEGLFDEPAFTSEGGTFELDTEGVAEDFDRVRVGVQCPRDGGDEVLVFRELLHGLLDHAFARAGNAEHEAEPSLLAVDLECVDDLLLAR